MKKISLILLSVLLALSIVSCSDSTSGDDLAAEEEIAEEAAADVAEPVSAEEIPEVSEEETEENTPPPAPTNVEFTPFTDLNLSKPAEIIDGTLVMYFTDEDLWYEPNAECNVGMISSEAADTIKGSLDMTSYPDMFNGDDYRGAAIIPAEPIPSGNYTFSVTFGQYRVAFDMNVD